MNGQIKGAKGKMNSLENREEIDLGWTLLKSKKIAAYKDLLKALETLVEQVKEDIEELKQ